MVLKKGNKKNEIEGLSLFKQMRRGIATQDKLERIEYSVECNEEVKADTEDSGHYDKELEDQDEPEQNELNVQENAQEEQDNDEDKMAEVKMSKKTWGGNSIMTNTNGRSLFKMMSYATYKTIEGFPPAGCFWLVR